MPSTHLPEPGNDVQPVRLPDAAAGLETVAGRPPLPEGERRDKHEALQSVPPRDREGGIEVLTYEATASIFRGHPQEMALEVAMRDRDDIEERWSETTTGLAGELLDILDGAAPTFNLRRLARTFYQEGWEDRALKDFSRLLRRAMRETKEQVESPAPEPVPEEVERPREGGAVEEGVAPSAPLGEAPLNERPEIEGVGGADKPYRFTGSYLGLPETFEVYAGGVYRERGRYNPWQVGCSAAGQEILRLANRVQELEERNRSVEASAGVTSSIKDDLALRVGKLESVLRTVRRDLAPYSGFVAGPIVRGAMDRIDQILSWSARLDEKPGDVAGVSPNGTGNGEGGPDDPGRVGEGADDTNRI